MKHELEYNLVSCPNCKGLMLPAKHTNQLVFVCPNKSCCWITGPDTTVASYLRSLQGTS